MTADKPFKRLVRQRMQRTGQSYAAARQSLRQPERKTQQHLYQQMAVIQTTIREQLSPIAEANNKPLDPGLVSAIMCERVTKDDGANHWLVHLYTLSPGLVIGPSGATVDELRARLLAVTGDQLLHLNLVDFGKVHANRHLLSA